MSTCILHITRLHLRFLLRAAGATLPGAGS